MASVQAFCQVGKHASVETVYVNQSKPILPDGWSMVRASFVDGRWVRDDNSPAQIPVCALHSLNGG